MTDSPDHDPTSPPSYTPESPTGSSSGRHFIANSTGFPGGYFLIKSIANKKVLDVCRNENEDGTELLLWTEKETSLVEVMRDREADNQLFFIDYTGALCSKSAGLPVDIEGNKLVLRRHRPVTYPFPNAYSHPLPRFSYDRTSAFIHVTFVCDPSYPAPSAFPSNSWKQRDYLITSVPQRRPKSFFENTAAFLADSVSRININNPFGGPATASSSVHVDRGEFDLRADEVMEEERGVEDEEDDSESQRREVVMLNLPIGWTEKERNLLAISRRQWEIVPVLATRNVTRPRPSSSEVHREPSRS